MTLIELISAYHARKVFPVFNRSSHGKLLQESISDFSQGEFSALEIFAKNNGFRVVEEDFKFRYRFVPLERPEDYEKWTKEDVPVDEHTG